MSNATNHAANAAASGKNHTTGTKQFSWSFVVTALLYALAGGPPGFTGLFLMSTFFFGLHVYTNSGGLEKCAIACLMGAFLFINVASMALPHPASQTPLHLIPAMWIIYKVMFVFGISLLITPAGEWVKERIGQSWTIFVAFLVQGVLALVIYQDKQHERTAPVACEVVIDKVCTPVPKTVAWYTSLSAVEDTAFGIQVALLMAVFAPSSKRDDSMEAPKNATQSQ